MNDRTHHAHRVVFIDLARAAAVIMMVYGHTVSALLAVEYRTGVWHDVWVFQRGLTSSLFLLLAGFAFSIATIRHWPSHTRPTAAVWRRLRRFALYVLLGYALHFPVPNLAAIAGATEEQWEAFFAVDILQLIGVTFIAVQLLVLAAQRRRVFAAAAFALAALVLATTPAMWAADWRSVVPLPVASYFSTAAGSLFPLFPWAAFVLAGAGIGQVYARWGAGHLGSFATWAMLVPGAAIVGLVLLSGASMAPAAGAGPGEWVPPQMLVRIGASLMLLGVVAHASRFMTRLPHVFGAVAQESLLVYFVHLCIVYGSVWNPGLQRWFAEALPPLPTVAIVIALVGSMLVLAARWNALKHANPDRARRVTAAVGVVLTLLLLV